MDDNSERVGAIMEAHGGVVKFLGYGTYLGYEDIPENSGIIFMGMDASGLSNPKIQLDNGDVVWGCECWWGNLERVGKILAAAKEIINVSIKDYRNN